MPAGATVSDVEALLGLKSLHVGDRVRFTPRLECRICWGNRHARDHAPEDFDGKYGVIIGVGSPDRSTHPYLVRSLTGPPGVWDCARTEIERRP